MKRFLLLITALICFGPAVALAHDILVVQGLAVKPYDDALRGFREQCGGDVRRVYLSDLEGRDVARVLREEKARLIVAIGPEALKKVQGVRNVPVLYLMVVNPQKIIRQADNLSGVAMNAPAERYFDLLEKMSPKPKTIGVIYDPAKSGYQVKQAQDKARAKGFVLVAKEVRTSREVPAALDTIKSGIDALWVLPDTTVVTPETMEFFLLTSQERKIPVIAFAAKYVEMGAVAALDLDSYDQGRQAGEMAVRILEGSEASEIAATEARKTTLKVNPHVARTLGITLSR